MVSMTSESRTTAQTKHKKAGHESVEMGLLINSFGTTVPAVFQKGGTASDAIQKVAVAESFEEWDCGDGQSGVADGIEDLGDAWETSMTSTIDSLQVPFGEQDHCVVARAQARLMTTASRGFWTSLRGWMSKFHGRLMSKAVRGPGAGQSPRDHEVMLIAMRSEAWGLISQVLRDIFADFHKARRMGNPAVNMVPGVLRTSTVLYALLRGHQFMEELLAAHIERHPCLSPSLNNFCISQRASLAELQRIEAKANHAIRLHDTLKAELHAAKKKS